MSEEDEKKQVTLWMEESKRDDWDRYTDELGLESRSVLIRRAVEYFYNSQQKGENMEVIDAIDELSVKMDNMDLKIDGIKQEQLEGDDIDEIAVELESALTREIISEMAYMFAQVDSIEEIDEEMIPSGTDI